MSCVCCRWPTRSHVLLVTLWDAPCREGDQREMSSSSSMPSHNSQQHIPTSLPSPSSLLLPYSILPSPSSSLPKEATFVLTRQSLGTRPHFLLLTMMKRGSQLLEPANPLVESQPMLEDLCWIHALGSTTD